MEDKFTVIFDFDGTLVNSIGVALRVYNENLEEFGSLPASEEDIPKFQKLGYKKTMKSLNIRWTTLPKVVITIAREMKQHMSEVEPYPGVIDVLKDLRKEGISIGVLTSNSGALVKEYFQVNNFPDFDFVVSEKTLFGKEKALRKIVKRHDLSLDRVLYVGDEPRDVNSCHKAGIKIIGVSWGLGGVDGLKPTKPYKIVDTTSELLNEILKVHKSK